MTEQVYRVPADGHGTVFVEAADEEEAFEVAREQATPADADMSVSIGDSYRDRVRVVEDPRRPPINVQPETVDDVHIPEFGTVDDLRRARERLGVSQREIASHLGISPKTVSHYETGNREVSLDRAREYANVLDLYSRTSDAEVEA